MRRIPPLILVLLLLSACDDNTSPSAPLLNLPRREAATATPSLNSDGGRVPASSFAPSSSAPPLTLVPDANDHPPANDNPDNYADLTVPAGGWSEPSGKPVCSRFKTSDDATHYMREHDYRRLDGDSDGVACESLP